MIACMDGPRKLPVEELEKDCTVNQLQRRLKRILAYS